MTEVLLSRSLLKRPSICMGLLITALMTFEGLNWLFAFNEKLKVVGEMGGGFHYVWAIVRGLILPEFVTLVIVLKLLDFVHDFFHLKELPLQARNFLRYQLSLLPILLLAFFLFNPVTQTVRYLLEQFPNYSIDSYLDGYLLGTYNLKIYLCYLLPVMVVGYGTVNGSLLMDILEQRRQVRQQLEEMAEVRALQLKVAPESTRMALSHLKARNNHGELVVPVHECYYFETEDRTYFAVHPNGRYAISKTMNELEAELNPLMFFRVRRDCIVNLSFVDSYSYWEKGKYIIRLRTPRSNEVEMPRARLHDFKSKLERFHGPAESGATPRQWITNVPV